MDLTEAEDIKKRWQEYTELYKKDLYDPDNHDGVITNLEPDILECKVKWALGSITTKKTNGGDGIPVELFQILNDDAVKVLHSMCQHFLFQSQRKAMPKNAQTTAQLHSSHMLVAPHSGTLAWKIPWTEERGGLQSMGSLRVGHD